jgi:hypothetical protein
LRFQALASFHLAARRVSVALEKRHCRFQDAGEIALEITEDRAADPMTAVRRLTRRMRQLLDLGDFA